MAPKTALLTAGTNSLQNPTYPPRPLTTQAKIAKAAAKKDNIKNIPREAPVDKKPKPRSLPPPGETAAAALAKVKNGGAGGAKSRYAKPLTTQQKQRAAEAKAKARAPFGTTVREAKAKTKAEKEKAKVKKAGSKNAGEGKVSAGSAVSKRTAKAKPPGMLSVLRSHDSSVIRFAKGAGGGVLFRRTRRAERWVKEKRERILGAPEMRKLWMDADVQKVLKSVKGDVEKVLRLLKQEAYLRSKFGKLVAMGLLPASGVLELTAVDVYGEKATFRFMELPKELRWVIYELVVVETKVFIRPDGMTGREQPDLAMVSTDVRAEVLPIFYGQNTFAIDLTPPSGGRRPGAGISGLFAATKWARAIDKGSSLSHIRGWVFDYAAPVFTASDEADDDHSLMLSVRFSKTHKCNRSATVEVHRDALCIMPGFPGHGTCNVKLTPSWVNDLVIDVCESVKSGSIPSEMVTGLGKALKPRIGELVESRCEKVEVVRSIEGASKDEAAQARAYHGVGGKSQAHSLFSLGPHLERAYRRTGG